MHTAVTELYIAVLSYISD